MQLPIIWRKEGWKSLFWRAVTASGMEDPAGMAVVSDSLDEM